MPYSSLTLRPALCAMKKFVISYIGQSAGLRSKPLSSSAFYFSPKEIRTSVKMKYSNKAKAEYLANSVLTSNKALIETMQKAHCTITLRYTN